MEFLREFIAFLSSRKKLWLFPILFVFIVIGALLVAVKGSVLAPFVYTLF